jgi:endo-1,4-beta-xylanase
MNRLPRLQSLLIFLSLCLSASAPSPVLAQNVREAEERLLRQSDENIEKYRKGDAEVRFLPGNAKWTSGAEVEIEQVTHEFLFGCILFDLIGGENTYREDLFKERFKQLFNFAVFPFYWPGYEPLQGRTRWEDMLPALEWCAQNGITAKGHPLVWACSSGVPDWLSAYPPESTEALLKARVMNIVGGFSGKIDIWDVVNEPVNVKTWRHKISDPEDPEDWGVRDSIDAIADYVSEALRWSHAANPSATLIINEYQTLANPEVRERFYRLLVELQRRKAPISGVGVQGHEPRQEWFSPVEVWKTFDLYHGLGLPVHITEFHPQSSGVPITGGWQEGAWTPEAQAEFTNQFVRLCFGHPGVASINWWGFSDRNIWLPGGGLVDEEYRPKPVYTMLDQLINETWTTRTTLRTDRDGVLRFRGFYGKYQLKVRTPGGRLMVYPIHLRKDEANQWVFRLPE